MGLVGSEPAAAATCEHDDICFIGAIWGMSSPSGTLGAKVTLRANCMNPVYVDTDQYGLRIYSAGTSGVIEIGVVRGRLSYNGVVYSTPRRYYFAYNSAGPALHVSSQTYSYNSYLTATIHKPFLGSSSWQAWFNNALPEDRWNNPRPFTGASDLMQAGVWSNYHHGNTYGSVSSLYFYNLDGDITPRWDGYWTGGSIVTGLDPPQEAKWVDQFWWARVAQNGTC